MTYRRALEKNQHVVESAIPFTFAIRTYIPRDAKDAHPLLDGRKFNEAGEAAIEWLLDSGRSFQSYTVDNAFMIKFDREEDAVLFKMFCL